MIIEDYVPFEVAKLLKEKGFNELCFALYNPNKELIQCGVRLNNTQVGRVEGSCSAPTLQMAMKWLREVHKLFIEIYRIYDETIDTFTLYCFAINNEHANIYCKSRLNTYEEACEAAIKYCLTNLI